MARRWGLGPVFAQEWLTTSRQRRVYAGRVLFVGVLLLALSSVWWSQVAGRTFESIPAMAGVGRGFYNAIVFTQLTLVLLAAPATTAGGLCQDKARGNLVQLLITDLSDAEIVLGKLAARLVPIFGLVCAALPVLALGTLLGGIDPSALTGVFLITVGVAALGCAIAFNFSIWATKPHDVLLATYAVFAIWLLALPVWEMFTWLRGLPAPARWAIASNPYILALAFYQRPGTVGLVDCIGFSAAALAASAALAAFAIHRLRPVIVGQEDRPAERPSARGVPRLGIGGVRMGNGPGPSLEGDPALWYEWHRKRPTRGTQALYGLYFALAAGFSLLAIEDSVRPSTPARGLLPAYVNAFQVAMGLPLMLIAAATSLVEERARGSLDVLLATPLSTRGIVLAKWRGAFRQAPPLLLLPMSVAAPLAWENGRWPAVASFFLFLVAASAAWTSLGLALSTWVPHLGRAVTTAVVLYTLVGLGWPILALTLFGGPQGPGVGLSTASPFHGSFSLTMDIEVPGQLKDGSAWYLGWTAAYAAVAVVLLLATLATFDRSLGRIPERSRPGSSGSLAPRPPGDHPAGG